MRKWLAILVDFKPNIKLENWNKSMDEIYNWVYHESYHSFGQEKLKNIFVF